MSKSPRPPVEKMVEVRSLYFPDDPETVYFLPSGRPGFQIVVREDPYVGASMEVVEIKNEGRTYI